MRAHPSNSNATIIPPWLPSSPSQQYQRSRQRYRDDTHHLKTQKPTKIWRGGHSTASTSLALLLVRQLFSPSLSVNNNNTKRMHWIANWWPSLSLLMTAVHMTHLWSAAPAAVYSKAKARRWAPLSPATAPVANLLVLFRPMIPNKVVRFFKAAVHQQLYHHP